MRSKTLGVVFVAVVLVSLGSIYLRHPEISSFPNLGINGAPSTCDLSSPSEFRINPYGAAAPFWNGSYYTFKFARAITPPYTIAGADALSRRGCNVRSVQLDAKFVTNGNRAIGSDDEVVFFADDISSWKGQEFGVRFILAENVVFGYVQDGSDYFKQVPLMADDGSLHHFSIRVNHTGTESAFTWSVDGVVRASLTHSSTFDYSKLVYWMVMTTHRLTNGWDSTGDYMEVGNIEINA